MNIEQDDRERSSQSCVPQFLVADERGAQNSHLSGCHWRHEFECVCLDKNSIGRAGRGCATVKQDGALDEGLPRWRRKYRRPTAALCRRASAWCGRVGATFHMRSLVDVVILLRAWQVGPQSNYSLSSAYINREDDFVGRVEPVAVIIRPACKASGME
jgi:hypothetical protein